MAISISQTKFTLQLNSYHRHKPLLQTLISMSHGKSKRPICPSCSKPTRTCLCSRILTPPIPNSINVTILQHSLECNHPLNSTRIAKMGLKNLTIATVSDVNFQSQFLIHLFYPNLSKGLFSDEIEGTHDLFCEKKFKLD
jgi:DTW domain-containing protein YfiP